MAYIIMAVLFLMLLAVIKIVKGVIKFVLILILLGILIAVFAGRDEIEGSSVTTVSAPAEVTATGTATPGQ